jgi:hypothetical protein
VTDEERNMCEKVVRKEEEIFYEMTANDRLIKKLHNVCIYLFI